MHLWAASSLNTMSMTVSASCGVSTCFPLRSSRNWCMLTRAANFITTSNSLSLSRVIKTLFFTLITQKATFKLPKFGEQLGTKHYEDNMRKLLEQSSPDTTSTLIILAQYYGELFGCKRKQASSVEISSSIINRKPHPQVSAPVKPHQLSYNSFVGFTRSNFRCYFNLHKTHDNLSKNPWHESNY